MPRFIGRLCLRVLRCPEQFAGTAVYRAPLPEQKVLAFHRAKTAHKSRGAPQTLWVHDEAIHRAGRHLFVNHGIEGLHAHIQEVLSGPVLCTLWESLV